MDLAVMRFTDREQKAFIRHHSIGAAPLGQYAPRIPHQKSVALVHICMSGEEERTDYDCRTWTGNGEYR